MNAFDRPIKTQVNRPFSNDVNMSSVRLKNAWCVELFTWKPSYFGKNMSFSQHAVKFCYILLFLIFWKIWEELVLVYSFLLPHYCQLWKLEKLVIIVTLVRTLLIKMKKQGRECVRIISLLKKIFGKHFKVIVPVFLISSWYKIRHHSLTPPSFI